MPVFPVKYVPLSSGADAYYKASLMNAFTALESSRIANNLPILSGKVFFGGSYWAQLISSDYGSRILLFGGVANILLSGSSTSCIFSWADNSFDFSHESVGVDWLKGAGVDTIYTDLQYKIRSASTFSNTQSQFASKPAAYITKYQLPIWYEDGAIQVLNSDKEIVVVNTVDFGGAEIDNLSSVQSGSLVYFPRKFDSLWNKFEPVDHSIYNPITSNAIRSSHWLPSLFYVLPNNGVYDGGWHYGKFMMWTESMPDDYESLLSSVTVWFGNYLENRNRYAITKYGYCEILSEMNEKDFFILSLFLDEDPIQHPGNPSEVYSSRTGQKYGGTTPLGFERTSSINLIDVFTEPPNDAIKPIVHMWGFDSLVQDSAMTVNIDAVGIVVSVGTKAVLLRYKGYWKEIYRTEEYHSHSVSHDGNIVAFFEGEVGGVIEKVSAWDMYDPETEELCVGVDILDKQQQVGEIIPATKLSKVDIDINSLPVLNSGALEDPSIWYAPYMGIKYPQIGSGVVSIDKLECDGTKAWIGHYTDECMDSEIVEYTPQGSGGNVSFTVAGVEYSGSFGDANAFLPKVLFKGDDIQQLVFAEFVEGARGEDGISGYVTNPVESHSGVNENIRTLDENLIIGRVLPDNHVEVVGILGDPTYGGCFNEDGTEDYDCEWECVENRLEKEFIARTSCGQYGAFIDHKTIDPLEIIGNDDIEVGEYYSSSGGHGVVSWSFSHGEISEYGEILSITGCGSPGSVANASIMANDECGGSAVFMVRLPGGHWDNTEYVCAELVHVIDSSLCGMSRYHPTCYGYNISGFIKTIYTSIGLMIRGSSYYRSCADEGTLTSLQWTSDVLGRTNMEELICAKAELNADPDYPEVYIGCCEKRIEYWTCP